MNILFVALTGSDAVLFRYTELRFPFEVDVTGKYVWLNLIYNGKILASSSIPFYQDFQLTAYKNNTVLEFNKKSNMEFALKTMSDFSAKNFLVDFGDLEPGKCTKTAYGKLIFINIILIISFQPLTFFGKYKKDIILVVIIIYIQIRLQMFPVLWKTPIFSSSPSNS